MRQPRTRSASAAPPAPARSLKADAIAAAWIAGVILIAFLAWFFTEPLRANLLRRAVNRALAAEGSPLVLGEPIDPALLSRQTPRIGAWFGLEGDAGRRALVFTLVSEGAFFPSVAIVGAQGEVEQIVSLNAYLDRDIPYDAIVTHRRRIEGGSRRAAPRVTPAPVPVAPPPAAEPPAPSPGDHPAPVPRVEIEPERFSPDNDGVDDELVITLSAESEASIVEWVFEIRETEGTRQVFYREEGADPLPRRIVWDGRSNTGELVQAATDYTWVFEVTDVRDNKGAVEGRFSTDVLVIRDGDTLRMQVPSILFRSNSSSFTDGIPQDRVESNIRVLRRIAEILNRFQDYRITVEGHANPELGTVNEEVRELQPLSSARARAIVDWLAANGVDRERLSAIGRGGAQSLADPRDINNNWKNRRVEFILIR